VHSIKTQKLPSPESEKSVAFANWRLESRTTVCALSWRAGRRSMIRGQSLASGWRT
jgi:hypothetical protein